MDCFGVTNSKHDTRVSSSRYTCMWQIYCSQNDFCFTGVHGFMRVGNCQWLLVWPYGCFVNSSFGICLLSARKYFSIFAGYLLLFCYEFESFHLHDYQETTDLLQYFKFLVILSLPTHLEKKHVIPKYPNLTRFCGFQMSAWNRKFSKKATK